jgi:hypothetical protein
MTRLIETDRRTAWQPDSRHQPVPTILDRSGDLDPIGSQLSDRGTDVVAHEMQLRERLTIGWMHAELGGREREDQPARLRAAVLDIRPLKDVAHERPVCCCIAAVLQQMNRGDHRTEYGRRPITGETRFPPWGPLVLLTRFPRGS